MLVRMAALAVFVLCCRADDLASLVDKLLASSSDAERERILSESSPELYRACHDRANALFDNDKYEPARTAYLAAQAVALRLKDNASVARCDHDLARWYLRMEKPAMAIEVLEHGLKLSQFGNYKAVSMDLFRGLGVAQKRLGNLDAAANAAERSLSLARELHDKQGELDALINLSGVHGDSGDLRRAIIEENESLRIAESLGAHDDLAAILLNLGIEYFYQGDLEISLTHLDRALREARDARDQAFVFAQRALVQGQLKKDAEALESYARALKLSRQTSDTITEAATLFHRSDFLRERRRWAEALADAKAGLALVDPTENPWWFCEGLIERALAEAGRGDAGAALLTAREAERIARVSGGPVRMESALEAVGVAALASGHRDQAKAAFEEGVAALEAWRRHAATDQYQTQEFLEDKIGLYHGLIAVLVDEGRFAEAFRVAEQAKARKLTDILRNGRVQIDGGMTPDEKRTERKLAAAVTEWNKRLVSQAQPNAQMLAARDQAAAELSAWEARLYAMRPKLRLDRAEFAPLTLSEAADLLPDAQTAVLEFVAARDNLFGFVLTRTAMGKVSLVARRLAANREDLDRAVRDFQNRLATANYDFRTQAANLYARLFEPFHSTLNGKRLLCIVPDGPLWNVAFAALIQPSRRYLIQDYALFQAPSLTALRETRRLHARAMQPARVLAIGDPAMPEGFAPLPDAAEEVRQVGAIYGPGAGAIYTGANATEEQWRSAAPGYSILHLATHGVLNDVNPLYSYLVLAPGGTDDGMLEAREVLAQNLHAQLAVLSACETARGQVRYGEGLLGMSWAFLAAGTPATLVSQWKVTSSSTSRLMVAFHRHFASTASTTWHGKAHALQAAMLELGQLGNYQHPAYWAGFTIIGDGY
jgi:CHAT domain-containing protein